MNVNVKQAIELFDFCFSENGLTAYRLGAQLASQSFISYLGEDRYKTLCNFILKYIAELDIPKKRFVFYSKGSYWKFAMAYFACHYGV